MQIELEKIKNVDFKSLFNCIDELKFNVNIFSVLVEKNLLNNV